MEIKKKTSPSLCNPPPAPQISMSAPFPTSVSLGRATISRASFAVSARLATNWTEAVGTAQVRNHSHSRWGPRYPRGYRCWGHHQDHTRLGGKQRKSEAWNRWGVRPKRKEPGPRAWAWAWGFGGMFLGAVWLSAVFFPPWPSSELQGPCPGISGLSLVHFQCNAHTFPPLLWVLTSRGPDKCVLPMRFLCV